MKFLLKASEIQNLKKAEEKNKNRKKSNSDSQK